MAAAASGDAHIETLEGYVVDIACVRKYARNALAERAREHTRECALMGHCVESGYALVAVNGQVTLLDSEATPMVVHAVGKAAADRGIRLRAVRRSTEGEMHTAEVVVVE